MKRTFTSLVFGLTLLVGGGGVGLAQDFDAGVEAYKRGAYAMAFHWWSLLASQGNAKAQFQLGVMYKEGQGVTQDYVYAHMWYNIAAASGAQGSAWLRDYLAEKMTPAQIARAQELAKQCVAKNYKGC